MGSDMNLSDYIVDVKVDPPIIVTAGFPGTGKTSLGASFPHGIMIQAENSSTVLNEFKAEGRQLPALLAPLPAPSVTGELYRELMNQLNLILHGNHDRETLIIDTISALSGNLEKEIAMSDGVDTIGDAKGSYGKGYVFLRDLHSGIINMLCRIRDERGMAIVLIGHVEIDKIKVDPTVDSTYAVYNLKMDKPSAELYVQNSDLVAFIEHEEIVRSETAKTGKQVGVGKVLQTGKRNIVTSGANKMGYKQAKNRFFGMPNDIRYERGDNPLLQYIPFYSYLFSDQEENQQ